MCATSLRSVSVNNSRSPILEFYFDLSLYQLYFALVGVGAGMDAPVDG